MGTFLFVHGIVTYLGEGASLVLFGINSNVPIAQKEEKMEYRFKPSEKVCSQEMIIELDGDVIQKVTIVGGCAGNTVGVSHLIQGMKIDEAIERLKGIPCGYKGTSCPDQLSIALAEAKSKLMGKS